MGSIGVQLQRIDGSGPGKWDGLNRGVMLTLSYMTKFYNGMNQGVFTMNTQAEYQRCLSPRR